MKKGFDPLLCPRREYMPHGRGAHATWSPLPSRERVRVRGERCGRNTLTLGREVCTTYPSPRPSPSRGEGAKAHAHACPRSLHRLPLTPALSLKGRGSEGGGGGAARRWRGRGGRRR